MNKGNGNSSKVGKRNEKTRSGFTAIVASPDEFISQKRHKQVVLSANE